MQTDGNDKNYSSEAEANCVEKILVPAKEEFHYLWSHYPDLAHVKKSLMTLGTEKLNIFSHYPVAEGNSIIEIELRLGYLELNTNSANGANSKSNKKLSFNPNLKEEHANAIYLLLLSNKKEIQIAKDWTEFIYYYYKIRDKEVRTMITFESNTGKDIKSAKDAKESKISTIIKNKILNQTWPFAVKNKQFNVFKNGIRLSVSSETTVESIDAFVKPTYVRLGLRKEFKILNSSTESTIIFTKYWSGPTRADAEKNRLANTGTEYQLEFELNQTNKANQKTVAYSLLSMLIKLKDFLL